ncbi:hypothetical protein DPEC_G00197420 [Dallia pectoralis]|uniref:Uncharacterized protein n=1 Tax=Dallia pectoralis TaxID=75939 RepID=A0ACC2G7J9_DALPE|nr:hypothetical protein DPEC_G00197420 [Dallia pectoralis]
MAQGRQPGPGPTAGQPPTAAALKQRPLVGSASDPVGLGVQQRASPQPPMPATFSPISWGGREVQLSRQGSWEMLFLASAKSSRHFGERKRGGDSTVECRGGLESAYWKNL